MPIISVLFPVYNAVKVLPQAMRSLLNQTNRDFEVIAIDDGSDDGSGELLDHFAKSDGRIRVFHQGNAGALGKVLNRAAGLAEGRFLARQDADDASHPARFENQAKYLNLHPETALCGTWTWFIDESLGPLYSLEIPDEDKLLGGYLENGMNPFVHGSVMFRSDVFKNIGGYRGSITEDYDLWLRIHERSRVGMNTSLGYYHWRSISGISAGAHLRRKALIRLILKLHNERVKFNSELTNWELEYQEIAHRPLDEVHDDSRDTAMHYSRGLQLLYRHRFEAAKNEFKKASSGNGQYAQKARRNLSVFCLAPGLAFLYELHKKREPECYSRLLPLNTPIPEI